MVILIHCVFRLVPRLFHAVDSPQQDEVISAAKDESDALLFPILHEFSTAPPPLVQGLVPPYHFNVFEEVSAMVESALSRVVQMLMHQVLVSQSRHLTVGSHGVLQPRYMVQYTRSFIARQ